jgi:hypothetical protein
MQESITLITEKFFQILQSKQLTKLRIILFNNAKRFDGGLQLMVALFVCFHLMKSLILTGNPFILITAGIACFIVCLCAYKCFLMPMGIFNDLLLYFLLFNEDKVIIHAPDERKYYRGRYLRLPENKLQRYIASMREKKLGFSKFNLNLVAGRGQVIDLGAGLFARVPLNAIQRLDDIESFIN